MWWSTCCYWPPGTNATVAVALHDMQALLGELVAIAAGGSYEGDVEEEAAAAK